MLVDAIEAIYREDSNSAAAAPRRVVGRVRPDDGQPPAGRSKAVSASAPATFKAAGADAVPLTPRPSEEPR